MTPSDLDRLVEIGRQHRSLTIEDVRRHFPLAELSSEELAKLLARLEDAGVTIDIDPALLADRGRKPRAVVGQSLPEEQAPPPDRFETLARSIRAARDTSSALHPPPPHTGRPVAGFLVVALAVLLLLVLAVWIFV